MKAIQQDGDAPAPSINLFNRKRNAHLLLNSSWPIIMVLRMIIPILRYLNTHGSMVHVDVSFGKIKKVYYFANDDNKSSDTNHCRAVEWAELICKSSFGDNTSNETEMKDEETYEVITDLLEKKTT